METPWLIQRGKFNEVNGLIKGIDQLINLDYMGAAEFEFGALPASLKIMCRGVESLEVYATPFKANDGRGLFLLCTAEQKDPFMQHLKKLVEDKLQLKERTWLKEALQGTLSTYMLTDFWWDIDNNIMFCLGKKNCENVKKAIAAVRDRKKKENVKGWF